MSPAEGAPHERERGHGAGGAFEGAGDGLEELVSASIPGPFATTPAGRLARFLPRKLRRPSIARQLVGWFLLIGLVPLVLATLLGRRVATSLLTREATNALHAIASRQANQIEAYILERERTVTALARTPSLGDALERFAARTPTQVVDAQMRPFLTQFQDAAGWDDVFLVSVDGDVEFSVGRGPEVGTNLRNGPYRDTGLAKVAERALMLMSTEASDFAIYAPTGRPAAFFATPVLKDELVAGVAVFQMRTSEIHRIVSDYSGLGSTGETIVAARQGDEGLMLTPTRHDPLAAFTRRVSLAEIEGGRAKVTRGRSRWGRAVDYRGKNVLAVWSYVPLLRWNLVVKIDEAEAFAPVKRLEKLAELTLLPLAIVVIAAALAVGRTLSRPVVKLTRLARSIARGDLAQRAPVETRNEIGALAASLNEMAENLEKSIQQLSRYSRTLEDKVTERTRVITEKNADLTAALASLKTAQEQILQQEKMASLGALTAGIAHEIKNPLNFVNNFALLTVELVNELKELLEAEKGNVGASAAEELDTLLADLGQNAAKIHEHGKRADGIVKSMLLHSHGKPGERQPTDVNALVAEGVNLAYHSLRGQDNGFNAKIDQRLDPAIGPVTAVPQDLLRVFLNIAGNAFYALNEKKKAGGAFQPTLSVATRKTSDGLEVSIRDNGPGMPPEVVSRVFEPFFTTKPAGSGTGLGLSISYDIVTRGHGGVLRISSEPGQWTEFVVQLPA